jgi:hypothetical protein
MRKSTFARATPARRQNPSPVVKQAKIYSAGALTTLETTSMSPRAGRVAGAVVASRARVAPQHNRTMIESFKMTFMSELRIG